MSGHTADLGSPKCNLLKRCKPPERPKFKHSRLKEKLVGNTVLVSTTKRNELIDKVLASSMKKFRAWCKENGHPFRLSRRLIRKYLKS